jgi:hypothetical protein
MRLRSRCTSAPRFPTTSEAILVGEGDREHAQRHQQCDRLGRAGHEARDGRRGPLVDIGRPGVEGRRRGFEGEADDDHRQPGDQQQVAARHLAGYLSEVERPGCAVDKRRAKDENRRAETAHDQVLEARLDRLRALALQRAEHVQRDRQPLQAEEERQQVG